MNKKNKKEYLKIKEKIENFLRQSKIRDKSIRVKKKNQNYLEIEYKDGYLNPTKHYHRVLLSRPFFFIYKWMVITVCTVMPAGWLKNCLYRSLGMKIGKDVSISYGVIFDMGYPQLISIDDGSIIGTGVKILTHETTINKIRIGKIRIGKNSLIGLRSIIRSGITVGDNSAIGMGSVVIKDVKNKMLVAGVPAKKIKMLK